MEALRLEHRDLDDAIARLSANPLCDQLRLNRMKKRKLLLKDSIARLESRMIPDLDA
nr:YdcH family protein [Oleiagrimonas citrea]